MTIFLRLITVIMTTALCIVVFSALFEWLNAMPHTSWTLQPQRGEVPFYSALLWGAMLRAPGYVIVGTMPLVAILSAFEWRSVTNRWAYLLLWSIAGILVTSMAFLWLQPLRLFAAIVAGCAAGFLYWLIAGRRAGFASRHRA